MPFQVPGKMEGKVQRYPITPIPPPPMHAQFPAIGVRHRYGTFVIIDELPLTRHDHPKFIVCVMFTLGGVHSVSLGKRADT